MRLHAATCTVIGNSPLLQSRANLDGRTARTWIHSPHRLDRNQEIDAFAFDADQTHNAMIRGDIRAIGLLVRNADSGVLIRLGQLIANAGTDNLELK